jgi:hypothetical protein
VGFEAVVVIVTAPETTPAVVGANWDVKDATAPAAIVCPALIPVVLKPVPVVLTWLIVTVAVPLFVSVIDCVPALPTTTLLKLKLPGLGVNELLAATALPVIVRVCGEPGALLVIEIEPVALPGDVGANLAVKEVICPGVSVWGTVNPVMLNPAPLALPAVIERGAVPEFERVTETDPLLPT